MYGRTCDRFSRVECLYADEKWGRKDAAYLRSSCKGRCNLNWECGADGSELSQSDWKAIGLPLWEQSYLSSEDCDDAQSYRDHVGRKYYYI